MIIRQVKQDKPCDNKASKARYARHQDKLRQLKQQDKPCDNKASKARYARHPVRTAQFVAH